MSYDVVVLGSGPGGYSAAVRAGQYGLKTAIIEKDGKLGGTCLHVGCIPTKALLENAHALKVAQEAAEWGVTGVSSPAIDMARVHARKNKIVTGLTKGIEFLFKKNKITWIKGTGTLGAGKSVKVTTADGKSETHTATKALVICTGSRVKGLPQAGLELNKTTIISSDEALVLEKAPKAVAIVGAGAIGGYLGVKLALAGHDVTFVARGDNLKAIQAHGMKLELDTGEVLHAQNVRGCTIAEAGPHDYVFLTMKSHQVEPVAASLAGHHLDDLLAARARKQKNPLRGSHPSSSDTRSRPRHQPPRVPCRLRRPARAPGCPSESRSRHSRPGCCSRPPAGCS